MKFLHAADIHLDSPLAGLRARADLPDAVIQNCTRRAFTAMIDLALAEDVAFVVIAGDLYDADWKDFSTGLFFAQEMQRLGRPCFVLRGNHDARSLITRSLTLPSNVREFSSRTCETATLADLGVALHGHSFPNRAVPEDLSAGYPPPRAGMVNIGVLHTSAEDPGEHETYAPCSVAGLTIKGYDYWALGHIHARRVLAERPWVVFPGNLQGRHPKETGPKGCTLVTVEDRQVVAVEHRTVDVLRWAALEVDAAGADVATLTGRIADAVGATLAAADGRPVLARVTLLGATALHGTTARRYRAPRRRVPQRRVRTEGRPVRGVGARAHAAGSGGGGRRAGAAACRFRGRVERSGAGRRAARGTGIGAPATAGSRARRAGSSGRRRWPAQPRRGGMADRSRCTGRERTGMKLTRLDLLRYGHLADVALAFPEDAALHVVHGANEAGKSTALAAIADALFGFGHRTDFDFLHGAPALRIGFTLLARDGTEESFVRRKGRRDTLRDAADQVVAEDALLRFLGGASRELFERSFGLDGVRLRQGGQELLRSGGDAGESLLASTGLHNLRAAVVRIDDEARSLVGDGRGRRLLSEAVATSQRARREVEERSVVPRDWLAETAAQTAAADGLAQVQAATLALTAENSRLQRIRRVAPRLAELDAERDKLAALADVPHFPPDAEIRLRDAVAARRDAVRDAERESADAGRLATERAGMPQDPATLEAQDAIDALALRRPVVVQAANDLPGVRADVAAHRSKVADALDDLGVSQAPEAARDAVPAAGVRRTVQRLVSQRAALDARAASAGETLIAARRQRDLAANALHDAPAPPSPALLRRTIDAVRGEGPLDTDLARAERAFADAARDAAAALAALPLWQGDMAGLGACKLPLPADADAVALLLDRSGQTVAEIRAQADGLASEIATLEEAASRLAAGETVPTPDAVATARLVRDRIWRLIRRMHEGGSGPSIEEHAGLPAGPLPDAFEALRDDADRLADRRADDAQRVAEYLGTRARLDLLRGRRIATDAALTEAEAAAAEAMAAWHAVWEPAGLAPKSAAAMAEWRHDRAQVLRLAAAEAEARGRCDDLASRRARARSSLAALLPGEAADDDACGHGAARGGDVRGSRDRGERLSQPDRDPRTGGGTPARAGAGGEGCRRRARHLAHGLGAGCGGTRTCGGCLGGRCRGRARCLGAHRGNRSGLAGGRAARARHGGDHRDVRRRCARGAGAAWRSGHRRAAAGGCGAPCPQAGRCPQGRCGCGGSDAADRRPRGGGGRCGAATAHRRRGTGRAADDCRDGGRRRTGTRHRTRARPRPRRREHRTPRRDAAGAGRRPCGSRAAR